MYDYITECLNFESATSTLELIYVEPKSKILHRHPSATCKQETSQSLDKYLQKLKLWAEVYNYKSASPEEYHEAAFMDAFASGLRCSSIRPRLLENKYMLTEF
ncbi:hypothetical protein P879_11200 [Paragonimus westermani]|uniref:Uncharacterized protein n=1 Tax=Paragonimus westermani TaxID=34504 RepID=A0A8T0DFJ2_9TREM|nr:hypothetical protein P879_11200 [Paragonimus westermani]